MKQICEYKGYEPRILHYPDDPKNSEWDLGCDPDELPEGGFQTATGALDEGLEHCLSQGIDPDSLIVAEVYVSYFKPSEMDLKKSVNRLGDEYPEYLKEALEG